MVLRNRERNRDRLVIPSAVRLSTNTYWKLRGMIIMVKARIPHTESSIYSALSVNIPAKAAGRKRETKNMKVVNPIHKSRTHRMIFLIRSGLLAP